MPLWLTVSMLAIMAVPAIAQENAATEEPAATAEETSTPMSIDTVVATVNGTEITLGHMLVLRARLPQEYQQLEPQVLFDGILDQLVQQTVLGQEAGELDSVNRLLLANEERALLSSQVIAETARAATTDEAIQAIYDAEYATAGGEKEYNAAHILVETEEEAQAIVAEIEAGAEFSALAQERSTGPSGPSGGDLGWFGAGMMVEPFEAAVFALEPGQVSAPVQTQFGWHVIRLNETREKPAPTLDEVRDQIVEQIQRAAVEAQVTALEAAADITRPEPGAFDPAVLNDMSLLAGTE
jgi:peptidyl-prolyl cis-trans isomerase C